MDIIKVFKSKARRELFRLYFTNPDNEYYLRELERILAIPASMLRAELIRLVQAGLFMTRKKGNQIYYTLNKHYALYEEFKSIVFKTIGVRGLLQERVGKIKGIETAFIYGSFARHEEDAQSDIDIFVIGTVDEDCLVAEIEEIEDVLKREINYSLYSRRDFDDKKRKVDSFIKDLLRNPKIFLKGENSDLR
jgi:predicted nucleotidyltransferase